MPVTTTANGLTVVHRASGGIASATMPDVCKTPSAAGGTPVPVPYPNIAVSADLVSGTTTVMVDGQMVAIQGSKFVKSTGDEPGVAGGVLSGVFIMEASFISFSPTVSMDGMPVCRLTDKMLMNRGNTVCLGGVLQQPLPPGECSGVLTSSPEEPKFCVVENLKLMCDHTSRNFRLDAHVYPGATLQVLADKRAEKVKLTFEGSCGVTHEKPGCAKLHVIDEEGNELPVEGDKVTLPLNRDPGKHIKDWWTLIRKIVRGVEVGKDTYTVYGTTCDGGEGRLPGGEYALIEVYPNAGWSGELEFGYQHEKVEWVLDSKTTEENGKKKVQQKKVKAITKLEDEAKFTIKGKLSASIGATDLSPLEFGAEGAGPKASNADPLTRTFFRYTQAVLDQVARVLVSIQSFHSTKFDIKWPLIKIGGGVALAEIDEKPIVRASGSFYIDFNPFIGIQVSTDILDWLIIGASSIIPGLGTAFGTWLVRIKGRLAAGKKTDGYAQDEDVNASFQIGLIFTVSGDIAGGLGWKIEQGKIDVDTGKARLEANVTFSLEAIIKVEAKVWVVKASAGASVSALSKDGGGPSKITGKVFPKPGDDFPIGGSLSFNGVAIWYAYYVDVGAELEMGSKPPEGGKGKASMKQGFSNKPIDEREMIGVFLEPWQWPKPAEKSIVEAM